MDKFDKKIRQIKISRQPEAYLDDIFMNLIEYQLKDMPNNIYYKKDDMMLFEYSKFSNFFYYIDFLYIKLSKKYKLNDFKINTLIRIKAEQYLKLKNISVSIMINYI